MFAVLAFIAAGDIRQNGWAGPAGDRGARPDRRLAAVHALHRPHRQRRGDLRHARSASSVDPTVLLFIWLVLACGVIAVLWLLYRSAARSRYALRYLMPHQHRTAMAMAEVLVIGEDEALTPEEVAAGIDDYLFSFAAHDKWKAKLALSVLTVYPMFRFRPPFALISPDRRLEFIERCFIDDVVERRLPGFLRQLVQSMLFATQQLAIIGYYGDPRIGGVNRVRAVLEASRATEGGQEPSPRAARAGRQRAQRGRRRARQRRRGHHRERGRGRRARLPLGRARSRGRRAGGRQARRPPRLHRGRAGSVLESLCRRRHADVEGRPLPGAAGKVRRRQHRRQQRRLPRHPAPDAEALERSRRARRGASTRSG